MKYVRITRTVGPQTTIVFCQGEMGIAAVEELHHAVDPPVEDATLHLVLNLGEVDYVSSSVLQFLMEAQDRIKKKGGCTSLVGAGSAVRSAFQMAHLASLFEFCETLEELGISPPASRSSPARERVAPGGPEKIFPRPRPVRDAAFWRFWGGLARPDSGLAGLVDLPLPDASHAPCR